MDTFILFCVLLTVVDFSTGRVMYSSKSTCPSNCRCVSGKGNRYHSIFNDYMSQKVDGYKSKSDYEHGREMTCLGLLTIPNVLPTDLVKLNIYGGRKGLMNTKEEDVYSDEPAHAGSRGSSFYQITSLPKETFRSVPGLKDLVISGNRINEVNSELNSLQHLETLSLRKNNIQKVEEDTLRGLVRLEFLDIGNNYITKLPKKFFSDTVNLGTVKLGSNWIGLQGLHRDTFITLYQLRILDLSENQLTAIHPDIFRGNRLLEELNLSGNKLRVVEGSWFWPMPGLKKLNLKGNLLLSIRGIVFKPLRLLTDLNLAGNRIGFVQRNLFLPLPKLQKLDLSENSLHYLSSYIFADLGSLDELNLRKNGLKKMSVGAFMGLGKLKKLTLSGNNLQQIDSEVYKPLREVRKMDLSDNDIKSLKSRAFFGMHNIRELYLENNQITDIAEEALLVSWLRHYSRLVWLSLQNNKVSYLPKNVFRSAPHIKHLDLGYNDIYSLDENTFKTLRDLTTLKLENNLLSDLPDTIFQKSKKLQLLNLGHNKLLYLTANVFLPLIKVQEIGLSDNRIMSVPDTVFVNSSELVHVDMSNNDLRTLNMDMFLENRNLRRIKVSNSSLTRVNVKEIPSYKLDYLDLSDNKLTDLDAGLVSWMVQNGTLLVGGNILTCDCRINWLNDAIHSNFIHVPDHQKMICKTPVWTAGKVLAKLMKTDLICIRPQEYVTSQKPIKPSTRKPVVKEKKIYCQPKRLPRRILEEWHATVFNTKRESVCSGVRLSNEFVLTHASCWKYHGINSTDVQKGRIYIKTGSERDPRTAFIFKAKKVIFHPQMSVSARSEYRAIALVHIDPLRPNSNSLSYPCITDPSRSLTPGRAPVYFLTAKSELIKPKTRIRLRTITTRGIRRGACDGVRYACTKSLLRAMPPWRYLTESAPLYDRNNLSLIGLRSMRQTAQLQTFIGLYDVADWIYGIIK